MLDVDILLELQTPELCFLLLVVHFPSQTLKLDFGQISEKKAQNLL